MSRPISKNTLDIYGQVTALGSDGKLFKVGDIVDELGLSRQLVTNVLGRLVSLGFLTHSGAKYAINDMGAFNTWWLDIVKKTEDSRVQRIQTTHALIDEKFVEQVKSFTDTILFAQKSKHEEMHNLKLAGIAELDRAIRELKRERKFLVTHQRPMHNKDLTKNMDEAIDWMHSYD